MSDSYGRPLVPYFEEEKKADIHVTPKQRKQESKGVVKVRAFGKDGYFSEAKETQVDFHARPLVPYEMDLPEELVQKQSPKPRDTPQTTSLSNQKLRKKKPTSAEKATPYAAPAFLRSPEPESLPLPKFLSSIGIAGLNRNEKKETVTEPTYQKTGEKPKTINISTPSMSSPATAVLFKPSELSSSASAPFTPLKPSELFSSKSTSFTPLKPKDLAPVSTSELTDKLKDMLQLSNK